MTETDYEIMRLRVLYWQARARQSEIQVEAEKICARIFSNNAPAIAAQGIVSLQEEYKLMSTQRTDALRTLLQMGGKLYIEDSAPDIQKPISE